MLRRRHLRSSLGATGDQVTTEKNATAGFALKRVVVDNAAGKSWRETVRITAPHQVLGEFCKHEFSTTKPVERRHSVWLESQRTFAWWTRTNVTGM